MNREHELHKIEAALKLAQIKAARAENPESRDAWAETVTMWTDQLAYYLRLPASMWTEPERTK